MMGLSNVPWANLQAYRPGFGSKQSEATQQSESVQLSLIQYSLLFPFVFIIGDDAVFVQFV